MTKNLNCQVKTPPGISLTGTMATTFFFTKMKFHQRPGETKIAIGALVSGSEMSNFRS